MLIARDAALREGGVFAAARNVVVVVGDGAHRVVALPLFYIVVGGGEDGLGGDEEKKGAQGQEEGCWESHGWLIYRLGRGKTEITGFAFSELLLERERKYEEKSSSETMSERRKPKGQPLSKT